MSTDGGDFQVVKKKGKTRKNKTEFSSDRPTIGDDAYEVDVETLKVRIWQARQELKPSDFIQKLKETWKEVQEIYEAQCINPENHETKNEDTADGDNETASISCLPPELLKRLQQTSENEPKKNDVIKNIVCYGLGNFSSCPTARFQLSLLLLLGNMLQIPHERCHCYDPKFTKSEKALLEDLGLAVISQNEEGKRLCSEPTLFYMPHCGKPLFNNLLWANWVQNQLPSVVILGNSFESIHERLTENQMNNEALFIKKILPYLIERKVTNNFRFNDIFNDLSFHVFPCSKLDSAPQDLWENVEEPKYDHLESVEIIRKESAG